MENIENSVQPHGIIAKVFHWGFATVFIYALLKQLEEVEQLRDAALLRFEIIFAIGFLAILVVRFAYMHATRPTAMPASTAKGLRRLAYIGHLAIYATLAMTAITGLIIGAIYSSGTSAGISMDLALGLHAVSAQASLAMVLIHIAAAIYHRLKGDGIWTSMVPVWTEKR